MQKDRALGKSLLIEFKTPTKKYWAAQSGNDESDQERKIREKFKSRFRGLEVTEELKQAFEAKIRSKNYPNDLEEWLLSQVEALAAELRGEL